MKSKILVAYFTKGGATEEYAKTIAETLNASGFAVETSNLKENIPNVDAYHTIILGTGVRMFRVYRPWKKILKQKAINDKHLFMFLSSGTAIEDPEKAVQKFLQPLVKKYQLTPASMISLPGKIPEKWAKEEDKKETVKPEIAKDWAQQITKQLKSK